tara:strand:- start:445 stop:762 length:318 start_codon:yes stop_codon:yes gene_type:complete
MLSNKDNEKAFNALLKATQKNLLPFILRRIFGEKKEETIMAEARTSRPRSTAVTSMKDVVMPDTAKQAKAMLVSAASRISENIAMHGYKEDKRALTLLNGAIELL